MEAHEEMVMGLEMSPIIDPEDPRSMLLISCSKDSDVKVWDCKSNFELVKILDEHKKPVIYGSFYRQGGDLELVTVDCDSKMLNRGIDTNACFGVAEEASKLASGLAHSACFKGGKLAVGMETKV